MVDTAQTGDGWPLQSAPPDTTFSSCSAIASEGREPAAWWPPVAPSPQCSRRAAHTSSSDAGSASVTAGAGRLERQPREHVALRAQRHAAVHYRAASFGGRPWGRERKTASHLLSLHHDGTKPVGLTENQSAVGNLLQAPCRIL
jgi:hypothetical protein